MVQELRTRVPQRTVEQARAAVQAGHPAIFEAAKLVRYWRYEEEWMRYSVGRDGRRCAVRAPGERELAVRKVVVEEFGGDLLAYADSLRRAPEAEGAAG